MQLLDQLKHFISAAPATFPGVAHVNELVLKHFVFPDGNSVSCVRWNGTFLLTGTDVVRLLVFRFSLVGRIVMDRKKFEEGVFSDLRNLKVGQDAILEPSKSPLLAALFKHGCINTQKKQKIFFWFSVPHDRLFLDALARDLRRERLGAPTSTMVHGVQRSTPIAPRQAEIEDAVATITAQVDNAHLRRPLTHGSENLTSLLGTSTLFDGAATYKRRAVLPPRHDDPATRPYPCTVAGCGRRFKRLEHVQRHAATHTRTKPHACVFCGKTFSRADNAAVHERLHRVRRNT